MVGMNKNESNSGNKKAYREVHPKKLLVRGTSRRKRKFGPRSCGRQRRQPYILEKKSREKIMKKNVRLLTGREYLGGGVDEEPCGLCGSFFDGAGGSHFREPKGIN